MFGFGRNTHLYEACWKKGVAASVKTLDQYLWAVPTVAT